MGSLFSELKRRKVFRVTAGYLVGAWAILEFVSVVSPMLRLPEWAGPLVLVLLTIGLVGAVALSWTFEVTADGLRRTEPAAGSGGPANSKLDWALMAASVAIIVLVSYQQIFARAGGPGESSVMNAPTGFISIAVLPFVNLSGDPGQEFFSDGMTEEITSALAKVTGLQVVGRTSAFEFKGQNKDLNAIGKALRATHLLEGSVRKEGNQIRVTAQLIRADAGTHIWTDNYDRELKSVFAIQDEIAQAIAGALQIPLGLKAGETLVASRNIEPESYQDYLRAKALFRARGSSGKPVTAAAGLLEQVVARDPTYAPAWALLALAYSNAPQEDITYTRGSVEELRRVADTFLTKAEAAGREAIKLDPRSADAYAGAANAQVFRGRLLEMEDLYRQALKLDPLNPDALHGLSQQLVGLGRVKEGAPMRRQLLMLEPLVPRFNRDLGFLLQAEGQPEAALAVYKAMPPSIIGRAAFLGRTYAVMGQFKEAADAILSAPADAFEPGVAEAAARLLRMAPATAAPGDLPDLPSGLGFVYFFVGATERFVKVFWDGVERNADAGYIVWPANSFTADGPLVAARKSERFKTLARRLGLVDYWRARGWPDLCRPVGADDFVCD